MEPWMEADLRKQHEHFLRSVMLEAHNRKPQKVPLSKLRWRSQRRYRNEGLKLLVRDLNGGQARSQRS